MALLTAACLIGSGTSAGAQNKDAPPTSNVVLTTSLYGGVFLQAVSDANATSFSVQIDQSAFLNSRRTSIAIDDCDRVAGFIEAAALAVRNTNKFEMRGVGTLSIATGIAKVGVVGKDGKFKEEERNVVMLTAGQTGFFASKVEMNLVPEEAEKLAKALHVAPRIAARLKSSINFEAIHQAK